MDGLGGKGQRRKGDLVNENDQGLGASVEPGCLSQLPSVCCRRRCCDLLSFFIYSCVGKYFCSLLLL